MLKAKCKILKQFKSNWSLGIGNCKLNRGFSLVELVVAVTISGILMLGMSTFFSSTFTNIFRAQQASNQVQKQFAVNEIVRNKFLSLKKAVIGSGDESAFLLSDPSNGQLPFSYIGKKGDHLAFKDFLMFNKMDINPKNKSQHLYVNSGEGSVRAFRRGGAAFPDKNRLTGEFNNITSFVITDDFYILSYATENHIDMCRCQSGSCPKEQCQALPNLPPLNSPTDLTIGNKNLYISDSGNGRILKYNLAKKEVKIIAENLKYPTGIAHYAKGAKEYLFVAETLNNLVKKIDLNTEEITPFIGTGNDQNCANISAPFCQLNLPTGLFIPNEKDELYIADSGNNRILAVKNPKKPESLTFDLKTKDHYRLDRIAIENKYWPSNGEYNETESNLIGDKSNFDKSTKIFQNSNNLTIFDDQTSNCKTNTTGSSYFHVNENPSYLKPQQILRVDDEIITVNSISTTPVTCYPKKTTEKWRILANFNNRQSLGNNKTVHLSHPKDIKLKIDKIKLSNAENGFHTFAIKIFDRDGLVETFYKSLRTGDDFLGSMEDTIEVIADQGSQPQINFPTGVTDLYFANSGEGKIRRIDDPNVSNQLDAINEEKFEQFDYKSDFKVDTVHFELKGRLLELIIEAQTENQENKRYILNGALSK